MPWTASPRDVKALSHRHVSTKHASLRRGRTRRPGNGAALAVIASCSAQANKAPAGVHGLRNRSRYQARSGKQPHTGVKQRPPPPLWQRRCGSPSTRAEHVAVTPTQQASAGRVGSKADSLGHHTPRGVSRGCVQPKTEQAMNLPGGWKARTWPHGVLVCSTQAGACRVRLANPFGAAPRVAGCRSSGPAMSHSRDSVSPSPSIPRRAAAGPVAAGHKGCERKLI